MHGLLLDTAQYQNYNGHTIILDVELQLHWHRTDTVGNGGFIYKITYVSKLWTYTVEINSIKFVCR
jgi:hypothetical protein